jgi:hypothetical protein
MSWIRLAEETVKWWALVNTTMNFDFNKTRRIPFRAEGLPWFNPYPTNVENRVSS